MSRAAADGDRRAANAVQIGVVKSVSADRARAIVTVGDIDTAEIPVMQSRAGASSMHWMPGEGEQVVIACPSGDMARAVVLGGVFAGNVPSSDPSNPTMELGGGTFFINGNLQVTGDITLDGNLTVSGTITAQGEITAKGIPVSSHSHPNVRSGTSSTGAPQV